jgi:5'-nucleotidase (lipoprotein e(P4) family)
MKRCVRVSLVLMLAGCATPKPASYPLELHWFRNSAERRAIDTEIYAMASEVVSRSASGLAAGSFAVVLDVDETVLDNSEYQARLAKTGQSYRGDTWAAWVKEEKAVALPGAAAFTHFVRERLGGRVILVTNRELADCPVTELNLRQQGIGYDAIVCAPNGPDGKPVSDKNRRFDQVLKGEGATASFGPLNVIAYFGDNIQDFPRLGQSSSGDTSDFGRRYFAFPNPLYGSWTGNAYR